MVKKISCRVIRTAALSEKADVPASLKQVDDPKIPNIAHETLNDYSIGQVVDCYA